VGGGAGCVAIRLRGDIVMTQMTKRALTLTAVTRGHCTSPVPATAQALPTPPRRQSGHVGDGRRTSTIEHHDQGPSSRGVFDDGSARSNPQRAGRADGKIICVPAPA